MPTSSATNQQAVGLGEATRFWLKLGFISFGGPAGQIAVMHEELVDRRRWISERRFVHALGYCMVLPGPEAQQLATYIGWLLHGPVGGVIAGALFVLPSLAILIALSALYVTFGDVPLVDGVLDGLRPAVTAIVFHAAWRIGRRSLTHGLLAVVAALSFAAQWSGVVPFPAIIVAAGLAGYVGGRVSPGIFAVKPHRASAGRPHVAATIDDDTPTPAHARFTVGRLGTTAIVCLLLWALPIVALDALVGQASTFSIMAWFFTKAAFVTFGGAYAVLPYVYQAAVVQYGWLGAGQMLDGLALGETTPGPLIMVVAFVGFVGAYGDAPFGPDARMAAAILAAVVVTWFTFLPSFFFVLAGGPLVESTRGDVAFTSPLSAITAAVVGIILHLGVFFAVHVLWPAGFPGSFSWPAAVIGAAAVVAIFRYQWTTVQVIGACAVAGLVVRVMGW